jgi:transposase
MAAGHVGGSPRLVDKDEALWIEIKLAVELALPLAQDIGPVLLDRRPDLFYA